MLDNDPPPQTLVKFIREVRKSSTKNIGRLRRSLVTHYPGRVDLPDDRFEVEVDGEIIIVERRDIDKA